MTSFPSSAQTASGAAAALQSALNALQNRREVRAVAEVGSFATPLAWEGSRPFLLTFERRLSAPRRADLPSVGVWAYPYEQLENRFGWPDELSPVAPLGLIATGRVRYDPAGQLGRFQRKLLSLNGAEQLAWQRQLTAAASQELAAITANFERASGTVGQILALGQVRQLAQQLIYPALLARQGGWVSQPEIPGPRFPHYWRAQLELRQPAASAALESLYGFGGQAEAAQVLAAARGLKLEAESQLARRALQAGYADGATCLLRAAVFEQAQSDLKRWPHLSARRQEKLAAVLGLERCPVGVGALAQAKELVNLAEQL